jgi:hypothetical protein
MNPYPDDPNAWSKLKADVPEFSARANFQAIYDAITYDPAEHGDLASFFPRVPDGAVIDIAPGTYFAQIRLEHSVYIRATGDVVFNGTGADDILVCTADFLVIEGIKFVQTSTQRGGVVRVSAGYTSLVNCRLESPSLSPVVASGDGAVDLFSCEVCNSLNPGVHCIDSSRVRLNGSAIHGCRTAGVLVDGNAIAFFYSSSLTQNGGPGVVVRANGGLQLTETTLSQNGRAALDIASTGFIHLEKSIIQDSASGYGVAAHRSAGVRITDCQFLRCDFGAIYAYDKSVVASSSSRYQDAKRGAIVHVTTQAFVYSDGDSFRGAAIAALAADNRGKLEARNATIEDVTGCGAAVYEHSKLILSGCSIARCGMFGIQGRDQSVLEIEQLSISSTVLSCLVVTGNCNGCIQGSRFSDSQRSSSELSFLSSFSFFDCEFSASNDAGLVCRGPLSCRFEGCTFARNRKLGVDSGGENCVPVFVRCRFEGNLIVGVNSSDRSSIFVVSGVVVDCGGLGVVSQDGGKVVMQGAEVMRCSEAGVAVFGGGEIVCKEVQVHDNEILGCEVMGRGSRATFIDSMFAGQDSAPSMLATDEAVVQCEGCNFSTVAHPHCDVRCGAVLCLVKCDVSGSRGVGLQVHDGATLLMDGVAIHDERRYGVLVGINGTCNAVNSRVSDCGSGGLYSIEKAQAELEHCLFENNGQVALQLLGGTVEMEDCAVNGHTTFGVFVDPAASFSEVRTKFTGCGQKDIHHS